MASAGCTETVAAQSYRLVPGVQIRRESFGLLLYQRAGPRLYSLCSGSWLEPEYFGSGRTLAEWIHDTTGRPPAPGVLQALGKGLERLRKGGVIAEQGGATGA